MKMSMRRAALISVTAHLVLMALLSLLTRPAPPGAPEEIIPVQLVSLEQLPPEVPAARATALKIGPAPGPGREPSRAPLGGINPNAPRPKEAPAPPAVLTAKGGTWKVPPGRVGTTGTQGTGTEPAGPSYGPGAGPGGALPVYPKNALDQGLEGTVTLAITVSPQGKATGVRVAASSGHALLDEAARRSVEGWTFTPAMKAGKPAAGVVPVKIVFAKNSVERQ